MIDPANPALHYKDAEKTGDPGAVYIKYEFQDTLFMVQIVSDGAVVLYENMEPDFEMDLLMDIKKTLLDAGKA